MTEPNIPPAPRVYSPQEVIDGWIIVKRRSNYNISYILYYAYVIFGFFSGSPQDLPTPPDIIYTLKRKDTNTKRTIMLPGTHSREDLVAAITHLN